uniref:Uncharacterized protein n=1 Tax=Meloidogyne enterolobii TaxID=390850 RepID=A0A6V7WM57_MELEN|nr:unnamed protein product [Meloidogyne enterolobii]
MRKYNISIPSNLHVYISILSSIYGIILEPLFYIPIGVCFSNINLCTYNWIGGKSLPCSFPSI